MNDNKAAWFSAGIAVGAAAGTGLALLLAPKRGVETRQEMNKWGREIGMHGREAANGVLEKSRETAVRGRDNLTRKAQDLWSRVRPDNLHEEDPMNGETEPAIDKMT